MVDDAFTPAVARRLEPASEDLRDSADRMMTAPPTFESRAAAEAWLQQLDGHVAAVRRQGSAAQPGLGDWLAAAQLFAADARQQVAEHFPAAAEEDPAEDAGAAALARTGSAALARHKSSAERAARLAIQRSTRTLEAENAAVVAELAAARREIEEMRAAAATPTPGAGSSGGGQSLPRRQVSAVSAALLEKLAHIPIEATDAVAAIAAEYRPSATDDEDFDLAALPREALQRIMEVVDAAAAAKQAASAAMPPPPTRRPSVLRNPAALPETSPSRRARPDSGHSAAAGTLRLEKCAPWPHGR